jgi:MerR family transcriptional regulator/heat shock protein HspR
MVRGQGTSPGFPGDAPAPYDDPAVPFFSVGQVAEMLDVQHAFLRRLERFDLVTPARSDGAQRRYSRDDISRLSEICGLVGEGLSLAGVHRVLELQREISLLKEEIAELREAGRGSLGLST